MLWLALFAAAAAALAASGAPVACIQLTRVWANAEIPLLQAQAVALSADEKTVYMAGSTTTGCVVNVTADSFQTGGSHVGYISAVDVATGARRWCFRIGNATSITDISQVRLSEDQQWLLAVGSTSCVGGRGLVPQVRNSTADPRYTGGGTSDGLLLRIRAKDGWPQAVATIGGSGTDLLADVVALNKNATSVIVVGMSASNGLDPLYSKASITESDWLAARLEFNPVNISVVWLRQAGSNYTGDEIASTAWYHAGADVLHAFGSGGDATSAPTFRPLVGAAPVNITGLTAISWAVSNGTMLSVLNPFPGSGPQDAPNEVVWSEQLQRLVLSGVAAPSPLAPPPVQPYQGGPLDAFVATLSLNLSQAAGTSVPVPSLNWYTFLGGPGSEFMSPVQKGLLSVDEPAGKIQFFFSSFGNLTYTTANALTRVRLGTGLTGALAVLGQNGSVDALSYWSGHVISKTATAALSSGQLMLFGCSGGAFQNPLDNVSPDHVAPGAIQPDAAILLQGTSLGVLLCTRGNGSCDTVSTQQPSNFTMSASTSVASSTGLNLPHDGGVRKSSILPVGAVVGLVFGLVIGMAASLAGILYWRRKRRLQRQKGMSQDVATNVELRNVGDTGRHLVKQQQSFYEESAQVLSSSPAGVVGKSPPNGPVSTAARTPPYANATPLPSHSGRGLNYANAPGVQVGPQSVAGGVVYGNAGDPQQPPVKMEYANAVL